MKNTIVFFLFVCLLSCTPATKVDLLVIGGGASGTTAGIQSARMKINTLIIEEFDWLGGMLTSSGVSAIDGNYELPGGLWGEFKKNLTEHYGDAEKLKTGWVSSVLYEPSIGNAIWKKLAEKEDHLQVWYRTVPIKITRSNGYWNVEVTRNGKKQTIKATLLIDGTELGDVAAMCGVPYDIGMEARADCGESIAGEKANDVIQDLTYVAVLKDYGKDVTIPRPEGYDPSLFYCSCESSKCTNPKEKKRMSNSINMLNYGKLPNKKYMINWPIEGNDYYLNIIEMTPEQRKEALVKAKNQTLGFLYYMQTELGYSSLGLADDEFPTPDLLPFIPYHRESRRIHGIVRFNLNHVSEPYIQPEKLYRTSIAVGDYPVDHHHARYSGWSELPDLHFYPIPSFGVPLGVMIPCDVDGLIVAEKSISVSNLINGTTRLQPVVMQIGQAAGCLAALAIKNNQSVAKVDVRQVQQAVLDAGGYLLPYLDLPVTDPHFTAIQKIGATGILRGRGVNKGWENQTWFDADSLLQTDILSVGLKDFYPSFNYSFDSKELSVENAIHLLYTLLPSEDNKLTVDQFWKKVALDWNGLGLNDFESERFITRKEFAVLLNIYVDPFQYKVDLKGNIQIL